MIKTIIKFLGDNVKMIEQAVADFSDQEMFTRSVENANHSTWLIGHLIVSERGFIGKVKPEILPTVPPGFEEKFSKEFVGKELAEDFPSRAELMKQFVATREAVISAAKDLVPDDLVLTLVHASMHLGQIQVIRRKLGKPVLF